MLRTDRNFVFAYGSLLPRADSGEETAVVCHLDGFRRGWNVAMDNAVTIPGYKYYVDVGTGERPEIYVSFLNIWPAPGNRVNGVAYEVDEEILPLLDLRERNYDRHEVTAGVDSGIPGRVWAYVGQAEARERYEIGRARSTAVVSERYCDSVRDEFSRSGPGMLREFDRTTDGLEVPRRALRRIDLPDSGNGAHNGSDDSGPLRAWSRARPAPRLPPAD